MTPIRLQPDLIIDTSDPGDETLKRFRYQITYSCIASLTLLTHAEVEEIFCEHFEDVLIKLVSGKYIGVQVKTKDLKLGPFECTDEAIVGSIKKFIHLYITFPTLFEKFVIVTNNDFSKIKPAKDLSIFTKSCKDGNGNDLLKARSASKTWINKISKECKCTDQKVLEVLALMELKHHSSIDDIRKNLIERLRDDVRLKGSTYGQLEALADKLIMIHLNASSLNEESIVMDYLVSETPETATQQIINSKRITIEILNKIIDESVSNPVSLFLKDTQSIQTIPSGYQKLEIKMDAGNVTSENILLFKDNKYSVESLLASWIYKDTEDLSQKKYNQLRLIVQNECQAVYDSMLSSGRQVFGMDMLIEIRVKLRERFQQDRSSFYDCQYEHLLGMAGVLTEECNLWWSNKFDINP